MQETTTNIEGTAFNTCENLVDVCTGKPVKPMERTYGASICGRVKAKDAAMCPTCTEEQHPKHD